MLYFFFYFECCANLDLEFLLHFGLISKRRHEKFHIQHAANQLQNHGAWPLHSASRVPLSTTIASLVPQVVQDVIPTSVLTDNQLRGKPSTGNEMN